MILEKIKKHGVLQSLKIVRQKLNYKINNMIYYLCWLFPVNKKLIVFEVKAIYLIMHTHFLAVYG